MTSACKSCAAAVPGRTGGLYQFGCVHCCARLIRSARPLRHAQEAMFAAIARVHGAPDKADVVRHLKNIDGVSPEQAKGKHAMDLEVQSCKSALI